MVRIQATARRLALRSGAALLAGSAFGFAAADAATVDKDLFPGVLVVSRLVYEGNTFGNTDGFPAIFNNANVSGVQGALYFDEYLKINGRVPRIGYQRVDGITSSFSSKSEGALETSADRCSVTYIGYQGPVGAEGVSNSETPGATLTTNTAPTYNREIASLDIYGGVTLYPQTNAYSGDNPRAAISADGHEFYMAGNSDSSLNTDGTGPGTTIGARYVVAGSQNSVQLGVFKAADRPDESTKKHIKDNNFRAIGIFGGNLYVAKGSGGNGDNGVYQVKRGTGDGLPTGTGNTIVELLGSPATDPTTQANSPLTPFGFFFANATTLYVADEGYPNTDSSGKLIPDPMAGLQKWSLVNGTWTLDYILTAGLGMYNPVTVPGYPVATTTYGLRNLTGRTNANGTVTIDAITSQYSTFSNGEPDPDRLVEVYDTLSATSMPTDTKGGALETFATLAQARAGEVFRGVAYAPDRFVCGVSK